MDELIKIQFICEVCTSKLIIECKESLWTLKRYCEYCQGTRSFLRDVVLCSLDVEIEPYEPESIYLFRAANLYKIGISINPERRLRDLSISPIPVEFIWASQVKNAREIEKQLHNLFQEKHVHSEWYALSKEDVAWIKEWDGKI